MKPTPFKSETAKARAKCNTPKERAKSVGYRLLARVQKHFGYARKPRKQDTDAD